MRALSLIMLWLGFCGKRVCIRNNEKNGTIRVCTRGDPQIEMASIHFRKSIIQLKMLLFALYASMHINVRVYVCVCLGKFLANINLRGFAYAAIRLCPQHMATKTKQQIDKINAYEHQLRPNRRAFRQHIFILRH